MSPQLRYLHLLGDERIYLTHASRAWLQKRYPVCFGAPIKLPQQLYRRDIPYIQSLFSIMRDEIWQNNIRS